MDWTWGPADTWAKTAAYLRGVGASLGPKTKAILIISGHWETPEFSVTSAERPPLIYDYSGFPASTYQLKYDAPGDPALAARVCDLLGAAGFSARMDPTRGWDHGVFIPLKVAFPDADIPVVQLSLKADLDPAEHMAVGHALAPLRDEGVLILGSGLSFHNMRGFGDPRFSPVSDDFDAWLTGAVEAPDAERDQALAHWAEAPSGRLSHPREDHLLPLMVAEGAGAGDAGRRDFTDRALEVTLSAFRFG
jgi:aromatic ring-opening dioxygenase catalytic subunit (LigB family)